MPFILFLLCLPVSFHLMVSVKTEYAMPDHYKWIALYSQFQDNCSTFFQMQWWLQCMLWGKKSIVNEHLSYIPCPKSAARSSCRCPAGNLLICFIPWPDNLYHTDKLPSIPQLSPNLIQQGKTSSSVESPIIDFSWET